MMRAFFAGTGAAAAAAADSDVRRLYQATAIQKVAADTQLVTFTIPGGTLAAGDSVQIEVRGRKTGIAGVANLRVAFGATNSGATSWAGADAFHDACFCVEVTAADAQRIYTSWMRANGAAGIASPTAAAEVVAGDIVVTVSFTTALLDQVDCDQVRAYVFKAT
jgi:hypothetical protein